jgi:hypothetical protein
MAFNYKVLGQSTPSVTTNTDIYTVPSGKEAVVSTITIANLDTNPATYRIAVRPNGESLLNKHYIAYNAGVPANDTIALTIGLSLSDLDVMTVYASSASISFGVFGSEIS